MNAHIEAIVMPKLGLSMTEGMVAKWHVQLGAEVSSGDILADIETSKITNELEVHRAGFIKRILAQEGVELEVGALLAVIADEAASEAEIDQFINAFVVQDADDMDATESGDVAATETDQAAPEKPQTSAAAANIPERLHGGEDDAAVSATHLARRLAQKFAINLHNVTGTGRRGRISKKDIARAVQQAGEHLAVSAASEGALTPSEDDGHAPPATPTARRLARQAGVKLALITPTGSRGRVTRADVEDFIAASGQASEPHTGASTAMNEGDEVPLTPIRRRIAKRLSDSKRNAPHFRLTIEANIDPMLRLRADLNQAPCDTRISINDLLIKAVAMALMKNLDMNIQFDGDMIRRFANADVAVAVALDDGLITPIIRAANEKSIISISHEMSALVERTRAGSLLPDEFEGGTFTLSNLGMFGIKAFDAIINPPQAAILAVGAGEKRRIYTDNKSIMATVITATVCCDHRVIDGATGARFMQGLKSIIEHPGRMLM